MLISFTASFLFGVLGAGAAYFLTNRILGRRVITLERDLQIFSEAMSQMAEIQMKAYHKISGNMGGIEERLLELAIPSADSRLPLERRHQVLALARKGAAIEEIAQRLNLPRGEAELILSLHKYAEISSPRATRKHGESRNHV
jgi:DNA-binding NarL/FixJ family response regulator